MTYSEELGYDPEEWEECPPPDHFLVFSPFTRIVLSLSAIGCAVLFFWLIDSHNRKGEKKAGEAEEEEKVHRPSESSPTSDLLSTLTGLFTSSGRAADSPFVQKSFRDAERSPAAAAVKSDARPDELSSSFHYKKPEESPTAADVRAELDQASFELRDLLGEQQGAAKTKDQAPPVPPHRFALPEWSSIDKSFPDLTANQTSSISSLAQQGVEDATQRTTEVLGDIQPPTLTGVSDSLQGAYDRASAQAAHAADRAGETAQAAYDQAAQQLADAYERAGQSAHDAYDRVAAPVAETFGHAEQVGEPLAAAQHQAAQFAASVKEGASASDAYGRVADAYEHAGQAAHDAYASVSAQSADAYERAGQIAALVTDAFGQTAPAVQDSLSRAGQTAQDAYDRAAAPVADAYGRAGQFAAPVTDAFGQTASAVQDSLSRAGQTAQDAYDRSAAPVADAYDRAAAPAADAYDRAAAPVADAHDHLAQTTHEAYERAAEPLVTAQHQAAQFAAAAKKGASEAYGRVPADDYERVVLSAQEASERANLYPYGLEKDGATVIAPPTAAERQVAAAAERAAAAVDRAIADAHVDPETARLEEDFERVQRDLDNLMAEHQAPLGVIIPGSSTSTSPAVSAVRPEQQQQLLQQMTSPIDEHVRQLAAGLLTSDIGDRKTSSEIPSLHEIYEERQRQLSPPMLSPVKIPTMEDRAALRQWEEELAQKEQEKLSKLVDTIVGGDDISDIAASEGTEHLLPASRISMYSQDSSATQQPLAGMQDYGDQLEPQLPASAKINQKIDQISSALEQSLLSEIEQLARQTSTMQAELARARDSEYSADEVSEGVHDPRQDAFQPAGDVRFIKHSEKSDQPAPIAHRDSERQSGESDDFVKITPPSHSGAPSPSPALVALSSSEEEQLKKLVEEYDVIHSAAGGTLKKDASAPAALFAAPTVAAAAPAALLHDQDALQPVRHLQQSQSARQAVGISAEEQAQLDKVLRDFEDTSGAGRKDVRNRPLPRTPPHTPENTLMDAFGRPIQCLPEFGGEESVQYMMDGEPMSPTTEIRLPLAPRGSIGELKLQFPRLPSEAGIEVVDPAHANLPKGAFLPSDLEDVLASLVNVDSTDLYLPSAPQKDDEAIAAAAAQELQQLETPILTGATPEPARKEGGDSAFGERKPTVIRVEPPAPATPAAPHAAVHQQLQQAASLDLSQPLQPPMSSFDRPAADGAKPAAATATASADFVVRPPGAEVEAAHSMKPVMMPAFDVRIKRPTASKTIPHEELEKADAVFQDALDYMHAQKPPPKEPQQATGFIMEEEMLSSHGENAPRRPEKSADGTSKLVRTNEIFERLDPHDDHDDMTYAPEIQSLEIPPDQLSETSELPHEDLPVDDDFKSPEAQKLEAEIRAQESAVDESKSAMQHRAALAQAPHIISMNSSKHPRFPSTPSISSAKDSPKALRKQSSLLSILGVTSTQEMLLKIDSLEALSNAMRKAGLDSTNVIFGIDYTASNKYQGEESFGGHSLHTIHPNLKNPYQQVITILGRTLAPFTSTGNIPVYGFGDAKTSDWSVFSLKEGGHCTSLEEVLKTYNEVTPTVELSGPTNFSPLIYQAIEICQRTREYHILVIIADGQVTNEKATRRAIVQACQYPLSIIVVGVGDGPWDMMRVFDESLPKRPWDNFHFVEFHEVVRRASGAADGDVKVAIQSLLEIPDQYRCICNLGLLKGRSPSIAHKNQ